MNFPARYLMVFAAGLVCIALASTGSWPVWADEERSKGNAAAAGDSSDAEVSKEENYVPKTKRELSKMLNRMQFDVTQNEATEPPFNNVYWNNKKEGVYTCIVCERELFSSKTKYESGTGWPSFYAPIKSEHLGTRKDFRLFYSRTEVHCARCDAHLGHVFEDGPQPTGLRYCLNSASLKFVEAPKATPEKSSEKPSENSTEKSEATAK